MSLKALQRTGPLSVMEEFHDVPWKALDTLFPDLRNIITCSTALRRRSQRVGVNVLQNVTGIL